MAQCMNSSQPQVSVMQVVRPQPQLNTAEVMNNFVNQQPTQSTQSFLKLLKPSTGGDWNIQLINQSNSDVFCLHLCKSEDATLGATYLCTMSVYISEAVPKKCFYKKVF